MLKGERVLKLVPEGEGSASEQRAGGAEVSTRGKRKWWENYKEVAKATSHTMQ
jgi:hypothetical protein